eukprot:TRINITY_DN27462_c0_g1_i1.p1 TRINITY_DN27462_c0_g1~~TRINITY_DN27462_c0_g1_i1.p1  ORF type:complete len:471 (+),score=101.60 TRINITY_DN27462_c0_g1_i1:60-1472(+)
MGEGGRPAAPSPGRSENTEAVGAGRAALTSPQSGGLVGKTRRVTVRRTHYGERMGLAFDDALCETKVTEVWEGPCRAAGVEAGMTIVAVNYTPVHSLSAVPAAINAAPLDFVMELEVPPRTAPVSSVPAGCMSPPLPKAEDRGAVEQLQLQLEAARQQVKSVQTRAAQASERERELASDLLREKEAQHGAEKRHAQELLRQEQKVLESVRQNEILRTEMLMQFERQRTGVESGFEVKYKALLTQYEEEKADWRMTRIDLEQRLAAATRRAREFDVLHDELAVMRHYVKTGEVLEQTPVGEAPASPRCEPRSAQAEERPRDAASSGPSPVRVSAGGQATPPVALTASPTSVSRSFLGARRPPAPHGGLSRSTSPVRALSPAPFRQSPGPPALLARPPSAVDSVLEKARSLRERRVEGMAAPWRGVSGSPPAHRTPTNSGCGVTLSEIDRAREAEELTAARAAIARAQRREL